MDILKHIVEGIKNPDIKPTMVKAVMLLQNECYEEAEVLFEKLLSKYPQCYQARVGYFFAVNCIESLEEIKYESYDLVKQFYKSIDNADMKTKQYIKEVYLENGYYNVTTKYESMSSRMRLSNKIIELEKIIKILKEIGNYKDSFKLLHQYQNILQQYQKKQEKHKSRKKKIIPTSICVFILVAVIFGVSKLNEVFQKEEYYSQGQVAYNQNDLHLAMVYFQKSSGVKDSDELAKKMAYQLGRGAYDRGEYLLAKRYFAGAIGYLDAKMYVDKIITNPLSIATYPGFGHLGHVAISEDNKVIIDDRYTQHQAHEYLEEIKDVIQVNTHDNTILVVDKNGDVHGDNQYLEKPLSNVQYVDSYFYGIIGVDFDGNMIHGNNDNEASNEVKKMTKDWKNITKVDVFTDQGKTQIVGLKVDGTVEYAFINNRRDFSKYYKELDNWIDIVDIYVEDYQVVGMQADGTILRYYPKIESDNGQGWNEICKTYTNMKYLEAYGSNISGITNDGEIVNTFEGTYYQYDGRDIDEFVPSYQDVTYIKVVDNAYFILYKDGTLLQGSINDDDKYLDATLSDNIKQPHSGGIVSKYNIDGSLK